MKKLVLVGIILIAAGLVVLASYDPLVRVLAVGSPATSFQPGSISGAPAGSREICSSSGSCTTITSTGSGNTGSGNTGFFAGAPTSGTSPAVRFSGGSDVLVYVLGGYTAAIVGLIFVVVGELAGGHQEEKKAEAAPSAVR